MNLEGRISRHSSYRSILHLPHRMDMQVTRESPTWDSWVSFGLYITSSLTALSSPCHMVTGTISLMTYVFFLLSLGLNAKENSQP